MVKMWLTLYGVFSVVTAMIAVQPLASPTPPACPSVSGSWVLADGTQQNLTMKVSQTRCGISGSFIGRESRLRFNGEWTGGEKGFEYEGEYQTFSNKCEVRVRGMVKLDDNKLTTQVEINDSRQCDPSKEILGAAVWTRKR